MRFLVISVISLAFLSSCDRTSKDRYVSINSPIYIEQFDVEQTPTSLDCFPNDEIGIGSIKVLDSLLIVGHLNNWSIYDKTEKKHIGNYLSVGEGPEEFSYLLACSNSYFGLVNDTLSALIPDKDHHRIVKLNLQRCKERNPDCLSTYLHSDYMENKTWDAIICEPNSYFVSQPHPDMLGFNRVLIESDEPHRFSCAMEMDTLKVNDSGVLNLLARVTHYEPTQEMFVETMAYLNQINLFSRDGKTGKTLCVGRELDNLDLKELEFKTGNRKKGYITASVWPCGFGAAYSGQTELERMSGENIQSDLQFFDWDGNPRYRFKLPGYVISFDIDFDEKILYVVDNQDDLLRAYDATPIIESLR